MRAHHEAKLNHQGRARSSRAFEYPMTEQEYQQLRTASMRGRFSWNFYGHFESTEHNRILHVSVTDYIGCDTEKCRIVKALEDILDDFDHDHFKEV